MPRGVSPVDEAQLQRRLWTPALERPAVWYDAADISTITIETGVSEWRDKSGNGFNAIQSSTTNQPTYINQAINGLNIIRFNGSNQWLNHNANISPAPHTVFAIVRRLAGGSADYGTIYTAIQPNSSFGVVLSSKIAGSQNWGSYISSWTSSNFTLNNGETNILGIVTPTGTSGTELYRTNGNQVERSYASRYAGDANNRRAIGLDAGFNTGGFSGDIAEIILFRTNLPTSTNQIIEGYLAWKWGLVANLPAAHPFKNRPPLIGD
jgi:hypothetical protein